MRRKYETPNVPGGYHIVFGLLRNTYRYLLSCQQPTFRVMLFSCFSIYSIFLCLVSLYPKRFESRIVSYLDLLGQRVWQGWVLFCSGPSQFLAAEGIT